MRLGLGLTLLLPVVLLAALGPMLLADPQLIDIRIRNTAPLANWAHPLGTDILGRDSLARLAHGLRLSLITGLVSLLVALLIGALLGLLILTRQPRFAPIIVKTISQIMVLFWVITMSVFLYVLISDRLDTFQWSASEWRLKIVIHVVLLGAAIVLLVLRKKSSLLPEVVERTRWTGTGWRILRLLLAAPMLLPCILIALYLMDGAREFMPATLIIGISGGLIIAPFTLRTTLAAGQPNRAIIAISLGVFSAISWAMLTATYLGLYGFSESPDVANLGRLIGGELHSPNVKIIAIITLSITIAGLVLTGDGIRHAYNKRHA